VKLYLADLSPSSMSGSNFFLKNTTFPSWNTRVFSITVSEYKFQKSLEGLTERTKRKRKERERKREREKEMDFNVATRIFLSLFRPVARGCTISCSSESQDHPGIHEERRCFENRDTLPCSVIVITAIRNDLMAATNCITHVHESPDQKRILWTTRLIYFV